MDRKGRAGSGAGPVGGLAMAPATSARCLWNLIFAFFPRRASCPGSAGPIPAYTIAPKWKIKPSLPRRPRSGTVGRIPPKASGSSPDAGVPRAAGASAAIPESIRKGRVLSAARSAATAKGGNIAFERPACHSLRPEEFPESRVAFPTARAMGLGPFEGKNPPGALPPMSAEKATRANGALRIGH